MGGLDERGIRGGGGRARFGLFVWRGLEKQGLWRVGSGAGGKGWVGEELRWKSRPEGRPGRDEEGGVKPPLHEPRGGGARGQGERVAVILTGEEYDMGSRSPQ